MSSRYTCWDWLAAATADISVHSRRGLTVAQLGSGSSDALPQHHSGSCCVASCSARRGGVRRGSSASPICRSTFGRRPKARACRTFCARSALPWVICRQFQPNGQQLLAQERPRRQIVPLGLLCAWIVLDAAPKCGRSSWYLTADDPRNACPRTCPAQHALPGRQVRAVSQLVDGLWSCAPDMLVRLGGMPCSTAAPR